MDDMDEISEIPFTQKSYHFFTICITVCYTFIIIVQYFLVRFGLNKYLFDAIDFLIKLMRDQLIFLCNRFRPFRTCLCKYVKRAICNNKILEVLMREEKIAFAQHENYAGYFINF